MARAELLSPRAVAMATWRALAVVVVRWRAGSVDDKTMTAGALDRARLLMAFFRRGETGDRARRVSVHRDSGVIGVLGARPQKLLIALPHNFFLGGRGLTSHEPQKQSDVR